VKIAKLPLFSLDHPHPIWHHPRSSTPHQSNSGRRTESCNQLVDGRQLIDQVKGLAILWGVLDIDFHLRVEHANQVIYKYLLNKI
jgi:hypothetical protein